VEYSPPRPIKLTDEESELYSRIPDSPTHDGWHEVADAMESLVESLLKRNAVPEVRLRLFADPDYAETGMKSRQQVFQSNGTTGNEIFRHPHFIPYLRHFVYGPDLPKPAIDGLCQILKDDRGTSGMVMDQYRKFARDSIRKYGLNPSDAATEFFRLGVEIGMEIQAARTLRDAAKSTR
jgi:hypothetical protein